MRIMVLIWIWVEDVGLLLSSTSSSDGVVVSALDTFSADSGCVDQSMSR